VQCIDCERWLSFEQSVCRVVAARTSHRFLFILASANAAHNERAGGAAFAQQLATRCTTGDWTDQVAPAQSASACGDPVMVYIESTPAGRVAAILQLAERLVDARAVQAQMEPEVEAEKKRLSESAVDACLLAVSPGPAIAAWKAKCRGAFGAGFRASLQDIGQMGACEVRQREAGKSTVLNEQLSTLFRSVM
jgi:hypothetical protein